MSSISQTLSPPGPVALTLLLARREVAAILRSVWFYLVASGLCIIAWVYGESFQRSFEIESVLVTTHPLMALNVLLVALLGTVLGLRLASSLAWEREHRTLEVLVVGPVSPSVVVASKLMVEVGALALLIAIYLAYLLAAQPLGAGVIAMSDAFAIGLMPIHALPLMALGLLVSAWVRTVRGATVVYLGITLALGAFEVGLRTLSSASPDQLNLAAIYTRAAMQAVATFVDPVSPVARLTDLIGAPSGQEVPQSSATFAAAALTAAMIGLAAVAAHRRGALA